MRVLVIAPLPPPATGLSLASRELVSRMRGRHEAVVLDYGKGNLRQGLGGARRLAQVAGFLAQVARRGASADCVYFTLSQSLAGCVKDLLVILIVTRLLRRPLVVHLHGAGLREVVLDRHRALRAAARVLYRRVDAAIVLGPSLRGVFAGLLPEGRIHVVMNYAEEGFFAAPEAIRAKHARAGGLSVLYLSNLIYEKGYLQAAEALAGFSRRHPEVRLEAVFAGQPEDDSSVDRLREAINGTSGISYRGVARGEERFRLMREADVFILPSFNSFLEGQPLSILEAYAAGCVVLTTRHGGIPDVFGEPDNGFFVQKRSVADIEARLDAVLAMGAEARAAIGLCNNELARRRFRGERYASEIMSLIEAIARTAGPRSRKAQTGEAGHAQ
jgi:glycosyltransferase involved in cell wall biosynthesis